MNRIVFIGHLGADARLIENNGKPFIAFSVAESSQERTIWAECTKVVKAGETPKILEFLKKSKKVAIAGRAYAKIFNSEQGPQPQLGIFVDEIDLC